MNPIGPDSEYNAYLVRPLTSLFTSHSCIFFPYLYLLIIILQENIEKLFKKIEEMKKEKKEDEPIEKEMKAWPNE